MGGRTTKEMRDKWRKKMVEQDRCIVCGRPAVTKHRCQYHREQHLMRQKIYNTLKRKQK